MIRLSCEVLPEVERLVAAGKLNPTEAQGALDAMVRRAAPERAIH